MKNLLLQYKNLKTEFESKNSTFVAVNGISFELNKGEIVAIVGESGSGKSVTSLSTMRLISKPGKISGGEIIYTSKNNLTQDLLKLSEKEMRALRGNKIAMIFQEPMTSLNPVFKCGEQVSESLMLHLNLDKNQAKKRVIELFEEVLLPRAEEIYNSYPHQISGGQKQRVMIAMAIACNPEILIADEPTTALDVTVQKSILELLKGLQQKHNMGIIFITHDLGVVAELADRVVVMYKGNIAEEGTVNEIFNHAKHPYTKGLLACRPPLNRLLKGLPTISDFMKVDVQGNFKSIDLTVDQVLKKLEISKESKKLDQDKIYQNKPLLEVKNLKVYYPIETSILGKVKRELKAVDNLSFDVYPAETLGLVGESGCGKTTLGRAILQLIKPTDGEVWYKGKNLCELSTSEMREMRKELQIIFQDPYSSLNPRMSIGEAIKEPMTVHGIGNSLSDRKEKVIQLLQKVGLEAHSYNRYPHEFSGGQRQRICIARALAVNPKFIICDESVSALDVSVQAQVLNLLNDLKREMGFTYIFISHDLSVVKFMSDRMIVMNKGKIEEIGVAEDIYANPQKEYTKKLIAAIPKGEVKNE